MGSKKRRDSIPTQFTVNRADASVEFDKFIRRTTALVNGYSIDARQFPMCPICLVPSPDSDEHVPPASLGGQVMTSTCDRCNNDFGTAEEELRRFLELEIEVEASSSTDIVKGYRRATVTLRSSEGRPTAAFVTSAAPNFDDILAAGASGLRIKPVDVSLVLAAALKHAYLAACLFLKQIPDTEDAQRVRAILLAARDRDLVSLHTALAERPVAPPRWVEVDGVPPVVLIQPREVVPDWLLMFGGRFTVRWPFNDLQLSLETE